MRPIRCLLLAALMLPGTAMANGVEVCDVPPRFGVEATATAIVRTACQEHRMWLRPFIEADGRLASLGVTEAERAPLFDEVTPAWQRVAQYWRESGTLSSMAAGGTAGAASCIYPGGGREVDNDCRAFLVDNPWSAAFISWVMGRAPLPGFIGSPRHLDYIARAWRSPETSPYLFADPFTGKAAPGDMLCFLRADDEGLGPAGLRAALSGQGRLPTRSHCEIVVAANVGGDRTLYLIGGNVLNSVVMRKLPLDRSGRLEPATLGQAMAGVPGTHASAPDAGPVQAAAAAQPASGATPSHAAIPAASAGAAEAEDSATPINAAACRPGNAAACSFNRRDWAVLLKLKPQAQLGGILPLAGAPMAAPAAPPAPAQDTPEPAH
ncbi:DUF2272 domain-containing protein [Pseudoxanthomonas daejeonensis]|uniref:DUF2272 domain-containing protein n=1 Tax=Pseudoxanthomonas daejeonensis TaxID=266062 RepID=UPI001F547950|nr:DUF2272 domain-containing protein [Pseudoxanthomonas daejeonensis]UNK56697.1 DUF2272 domain-containing protein [Pseudoxanthomonas daejeonensis]